MAEHDPEHRDVDDLERVERRKQRVSRGVLLAVIVGAAVLVLSAVIDLTISPAYQSPWGELTPSSEPPDGAVP